MEIHGHILKGVVVLDADPGLPDGTEVTVTLPHHAANPPREMAGARHFPVVHGKIPGSVALTNDRIAEILDEDDASA